MATAKKGIPRRTAPAVLANSISAELAKARERLKQMEQEREAKGEGKLDARALKKNFAEALSRELAPRFANGLRKRFPGIKPDADGQGQESKARTAKGFKKLDVNYSTPDLGLGLGVSIKTINFRDAKTKRYTKNYTRVDAELRAEASDYHDRQPYAVMIAVVFIPDDACTDGSPKSPSCFGSAVQLFRFRAGRNTPKDPSTLFERVFIGIYNPQSGDVCFFDVMEKPPRNGLPAKALEFNVLIHEICTTYDARNNPVFEWADAEPELVAPPTASEEIAGVVEEDEED